MVAHDAKTNNAVPKMVLSVERMLPKPMNARSKALAHLDITLCVAEPDSPKLAKIGSVNTHLHD